MAARMISAAATPEPRQAANPFLRSMLRNASIRAPSEDGGRDVGSSGDSPGRKSAGVAFGGRGSTTPARHSYGGRLPPPASFRRSRTINGLLYAREKEASEWTDSGMEAAELDDSNLGR